MFISKIYHELKNINFAGEDNVLVLKEASELQISEPFLSFSSVAWAYHYNV